MTSILHRTTHHLVVGDVLVRRQVVFEPIIPRPLVAVLNETVLAHVHVYSLVLVLEIDHVIGIERSDLVLLALSEPLSCCQ